MDNKVIQNQINKYYKHIYNDTMYETEDIKIGKVKDIIEKLIKEKNEADNLRIEDDYLINCYEELMDKLGKKQQDDVIEIFIHPMSEFYSILNQKDLLDNLKKEYKLVARETEREN